MLNKVEPSSIPIKVDAMLFSYAPGHTPSKRKRIKELKKLLGNPEYINVERAIKELEDA